MANQERLDAASAEEHPQALRNVLSKLITANHVLHYHGVVDAYGHISARNPTDPTTFLISKDLAPALVSAADDIEVYRISDGSPVKERAPKGYSERFIHSEVYKHYAEVDVVIHSHNDAVLAFSISSIPLRPVYHMAGVMGSRVPVFDIALHYKTTDAVQDLLVSNDQLGAALAAGFNHASLTTKVYKYITSSSSDPVAWPAYSTVLMRGHGFTCIGRSIEEAVFRAIYTCNNARVQQNALALQSSRNVGLVAARFGSPNTRAPAEHETIRYLSDRECSDAWQSLQKSIRRPWMLWCDEVRRCGLYNNQLESSDDGSR